MKKDGFYFPHFCNARNDVKILKLRRILSLEGYAIFFMLLEVLREQTEYKYPIQNIPELEYEFRTSKEKIFDVISNYDLFSIDTDNNFFSEKFDEYMQPYLRMKEQRRVAGLKSGEKRKMLCLQRHKELNDRSTTVQAPLNEIEQRKGKERKGKEIKINTKIISDAGEPALLQKIFEQREKEFKKDLFDYIKNSQNGIKEFWSANNYSESKKFISYWTEKNKNGKKFRFELQKVFDLSKRLSTWKQNAEKNIFKKPEQNKFESPQKYIKWNLIGDIDYYTPLELWHIYEKRFSGQIEKFKELELTSTPQNIKK